MRLAQRIVLTVVLTVVASCLAAPLLGMVTVRAKTDPWLGGHAALVCPRVCGGCRGPYEIRDGTLVNGTSRRGEPSRMYCQPPSGALPASGDLRPYELESGALWVSAGALVLVAPVLALVVFAGLGLVRRRGASSPAGGSPPRS